MGGCRRQVGCNEGLWRCNQHYRKGGHLCLHILGVRREAGARVEEECSEGWHLKWVWTKWSWGREGRETMSPGTEMVNRAWGVASPSPPGRGHQHLLHENLSEWLCSCLAPTSNPQKKKKKRKLGFPGGTVVKNLPANIGDMASIFESRRSPGEGNGNHSSILVWKIPWMEESGGLQSTG